MSQQPLHTLCVKQLMRATTHLITPLIVFAVVGVISAAPAHAQVQDIHSFVACLNSITTANPTVADAVACVPNGCYTTVTMSQESAQPGCTLRDGTRLPRVIYSCAGSGGSQVLRFRPSFTLCSTRIDGVVPINHIELGEDVNSRHVQKMADVDSALGFQALTEFGTDATAVVDTRFPYNNKGCFDCHDRQGSLTRTDGTIVNLFARVFPELAEGTIYNNDPGVVSPAVQTPLSDICTGIANSTQLQANPARFALAVSLCSKLELKTH